MFILGHFKKRSAKLFFSFQQHVDGVDGLDMLRKTWRNSELVSSTNGLEAQCEPLLVISIKDSQDLNKKYHIKFLSSGNFDLILQLVKCASFLSFLAMPGEVINFLKDIPVLFEFGWKWKIVLRCIVRFDKTCETFVCRNDRIRFVVIVGVRSCSGNVVEQQLSAAGKLLLKAKQTLW